MQRTFFDSCFSGSAAGLGAAAAAAAASSSSSASSARQTTQHSTAQHTAAQHKQPLEVAVRRQPRITKERSKDRLLE
jgi:hypothetical protein